MNHPQPELGKTLLEQADDLIAAGDSAFAAMDIELGERLDAEVRDLIEQNSRRIGAAQIRLAGYSQETQAAAEDNAGSTAPWSSYRSESQRYAEYWELAADSADCLSWV